MGNIFGIENENTPCLVYRRCEEENMQAVDVLDGVHLRKAADFCT